MDVRRQKIENSLKVENGTVRSRVKLEIFVSGEISSVFQAFLCPGNSYENQCINENRKGSLSGKNCDCLPSVVPAA